MLTRPEKLRRTLGYLPQGFGVYPRVSAYARLAMTVRCCARSSLATTRPRKCGPIPPTARDQRSLTAGPWADEPIHREKPLRHAMPDHLRRGNATKSRLRCPVEHVLAQQKDWMGLFIRTVGIERARAKLGRVNIAY